MLLALCAVKILNYSALTRSIAVLAVTIRHVTYNKNEDIRIHCSLSASVNTVINCLYRITANDAIVVTGVGGKQAMYEIWTVFVNEIVNTRILTRTAHIIGRTIVTISLILNIVLGY